MGSPQASMGMAETETQEMNLVFVHGIADGIENGWERNWFAMVRPHLRREIESINFFGISWERIHESRYDPTQSSRRNLLQDLGALTNPEVHLHIEARLKSIEDSIEATWIIAHSLGTALTYQALESLRIQKSPLRVQKFVTVGSPLWIPYSWITRKLTALNILMPRAKPLLNVRGWWNLAGRYDPIAGFGFRGLPPALNKRCWSRHPFEHYAQTKEFRKILEMP